MNETQNSDLCLNEQTQCAEFSGESDPKGKKIVSIFEVDLKNIRSLSKGTEVKTRRKNNPWRKYLCLFSALWQNHLAIIDKKEIENLSKFC